MYTLSNAKLESAGEQLTVLTQTSVFKFNVSFLVILQFFLEDETLVVFDENGDDLKFTFKNNLIVKKQSSEVLNEKVIKTPMPCTVVKMFVKTDQKVKKGDILAILEAMKMEHTIKSPADSKVVSILAKEGQFMEANQTLINLE